MLAACCYELNTSCQPVHPEPLPQATAARHTQLLQALARLCMRNSDGDTPFPTHAGAMHKVAITMK
jgi:hypothetical protein